MKRKLFYGFAVLILSVLVSGCSVKLIKRSPGDIEKIDELSGEVERLKDLARLRAEEAQRLKEAYELLRERLTKEISEKQVQVDLSEKGLTITFLAEVLFDSGKAKIRPEAFEILNKITDVVEEKLSHQRIGIDGHTDNEPIRYSPWKSNWELSSARAVNVLHYLVDERGISPDLVSATGYGEYRPVASNDTAEGRQKNRRVELVILPKYSGKKEAREESIEPVEPEERYYK